VCGEERRKQREREREERRGGIVEASVTKVNNRV
jgi:hypothetical protein